MPKGKVDLFGRRWDLPDSELCEACGQPDPDGKCNHRKLSDDVVAKLNGEEAYK